MAQHVSTQAVHWILAAVFLGFVASALIPDTLYNKDAKVSKHGALATTLVLFFLAEMGDKAQLATVALGAKYTDVVMVATGTTRGTAAENFPAVFAGGKLAARSSLSKMRFAAAMLFALSSILILLQIDFGLRRSS